MSFAEGDGGCIEDGFGIRGIGHDERGGALLAVQGTHVGGVVSGAGGASEGVGVHVGWVDVGWGFIQVRRKSECELIPIGGSIMLLARAGFRPFICWNEVGWRCSKPIASTVLADNVWVYSPTRCSYHFPFD